MLDKGKIGAKFATSAPRGEVMKIPVFMFLTVALCLAACAPYRQLDSLSVVGDGINMSAAPSATTATVEADGTVTLK
jgi:hypothetical protein